MMGVHPVLSDIGPVLPSRVAVHARALDLLDLARRAVEFSGTGRGADLALALRQLEHMRAVLGEGSPSSSAAVGPRGIGDA